MQVRATAAKLKQLADPGTIVISVSKGIEKDTSLRLSQVIEEELQGHCPVVVLSGPSHAEEVGRHVPTGVVAASEDLELARAGAGPVYEPPLPGLHQHRQGGHRAVRRPEEHHRPLRRLLRRHGLRGQHQGTAHDPGLAEMARLGVALGGKQETFAGWPAWGT